MKKHKFPNTDLVVSRIAYGCSLLGWDMDPTRTDPATLIRWSKEPLSSEAAAKAVRVINTALDRGITLFDHADMYAFGKSEAAFGHVLKQSPGLRSKIVIQSKCGVRIQGDPRPDDPFRIDFSREHIVSSVEGSLSRLGTDYLDILLLHMPDALVEPDQVAEAFDKLHRCGKVRYFGVSNHTVGQIELLRRYIRQPLVANQIHLGLAHSYLIADGIEANRDRSTRITHGYTGVAGTLDYCRLHDIQIQAYAPLRGGSIVEAPNLLNLSPDAAPEIKQAAEFVRDLAQKKKTTPSAVILAWLLRHPAGVIPIIGASRPEHVIENCAADNVTLSREDWYTLWVSALGIPSIQLLGIASANS